MRCVGLQSHLPLKSEVQRCQKMVVEGLHYTAYDSQLATIVQRAVQANDD